MNVPYGWLREYCDPGLSVEELAERLTMAGVKVEAIHRTGVGDPGSFVVGKVLSAEQHPDADRLKVCSVDAGEGEPRQIVCGAPNVEAGQTVAVALPGAVMPDGQALGEAKLRGVVSSGMILAEDEVGIGEDHAGTMVLPDDLAAGAPLNDHLRIADEVIEIEVVPNRPDTMAVHGVAREAHALTEAPLAPDPSDEDLPAPEVDFPIDIDPEICLRFTARVFEDVKVGPSPLWLKQRLMAAGQRPISNVVDITNYVMLLTGQPLHAFDLDEVRGGRIIVRKASEGERMVTLDGAERSFDSSMALVCDAEGPSGIAGIMGGQISEVSDRTTRVLMEAATWVGINISRTSARLGLRSEASARFEKQLHPELGPAAQRLSARLMTELCGARQVGQTDVYPSPAEPRVVALRPERIERLLGERVPEDTVRAILGRLGFEVDDDWNVRVPYWRDSDVQREVDLIEEVGRVYGLDKLPVTLPAREKAVGALTHSQRVRRRAEDALRDRGALEAIAYSFTREAALADLRLDGVPVLRLANPLSEEHRVMRPLLLPGLLDAARHNAAHGRPALTLFESAHVYRMSTPLDAPGPQDGAEETSTPAEERHHIGSVSTSAPDFLAAKALLEALLRALDVEGWTEPGERPFLHPGRSASVVARGAAAGGHPASKGDESKIGWVGELHPAVARAWDLGRVAAFELDADALAELSPEVVRFEPFSPYPAVVQDIAVVVDEDVPYADVERLVREGGGELLEGVELFDLYRGEQAGEGRKSLALRLSFRAPDRTLTDEDVAALRKAIEERLAEVGGGSVPADVAVVGASGYAGALCAWLVERHPELELVAATARSDAGLRLSDLYPRYRVDRVLEELDVDRVADSAGVALVAYPHGASAPVVAALRERDLKVVDLSADFRLDHGRYESYYGEHGAPELIEHAVYGLTELHREEIASADLVAAPGCYPTAALLALAPLRHLMVDAVVDAKSGVSGAGREPSQTTHFVSVAENMSAYKVEGHRHRAELEQELGDGARITFIPHLVPIDQGLLASCYVTVSRELSAQDVRALFKDAYGNEPFVELAASPPGVRDVRDTNLCRIHATVEPATGRVLVFAAIDNLWKGAAGQAVQDLNLMLGLDERAGLT